jgi:hypothetical protein
MAKLHIFYNYNENKTILEDDLKVKIDDETELEVGKYEEKEIELENGKHNIKMYVPYMNGSFGFTSEDVEINNEDLFYYYRAPLAYSQKGKFVKVNNSEDFSKQQKKNKLMSTIFLVLAIIIVLWSIFS